MRLLWINGFHALQGSRESEDEILPPALTSILSDHIVIGLRKKHKKFSNECTKEALKFKVTPKPLDLWPETHFQLIVNAPFLVSIATTKCCSLRAESTQRGDQGTRVENWNSCSKICRLSAGALQPAAQHKFDPKFECKINTNSYVVSRYFHTTLPELFSCIISTELNSNIYLFYSNSMCFIQSDLHEVHSVLWIRPKNCKNNIVFYFCHIQQIDP